MSTAVVDRSATPVDAAPVAAGPELPAEPAGVLAAARERRRGADRLEVELLRLAVHWAGINSVDPDAVDACEHRGGGLLTDRSFPIAGEGSPAVSESAVAEFAAAVGLSTGAGRHLVGNAVELAFRLRRLWAQTCAGRSTPGVPGRWPSRRCG